MSENNNGDNDDDCGGGGTSEIISNNCKEVIIMSHLDDYNILLLKVHTHTQMCLSHPSSYTPFQ